MSLDPEGSKPSYRPEVDGLRAIAVVSVIAYHLKSGLLPGGFLGVDIFFVLSGYLITSIIWREAQAGAFTFAVFYERRARRILPALLAMLFVTTVASAAILLPLDLIGYAKGALSTIAFVANVYFWRDSDYFSQEAALKPLLHMWSLGVEEQFYILFPPLILLVARFARRWAFIIVAMLLVASYALNVAMLRFGGANPAFYLLPTRGWELCVGAALAVRNGWRTPGSVAVALQTVGLLLIAVSIVGAQGIIAQSVPTPTLVVVGTTLLLVTSAHSASPVARALSSRPAVFVGLISYSLYLWHWPIIVLVNYYRIAPVDWPTAAAIIGATAACAVLSWRFVERPFRSRRLPVRTLLLWIMSGGTVIAASAAAIVHLQGLPARLPAEASLLNQAVGNFYRCPVQDYLTVGYARGCRVNLPSGNPNDADVALIGNSHALMYAPLLAKILHERGQHGILLNANSCLPSSKINISRECLTLANAYITQAATLPKATTVIIGLEWQIDGTPLVEATGAPYLGQAAAGLREGLDETIAILQRSGKHVILVGPIAVPGYSVASIASRSIAFGRPISRPIDQSYDTFKKQFGALLDYYGSRGDLVLMRPDEVQCTSSRCRYIVENHSIFADSSHISTPALYMFSGIFRRALDDKAIDVEALQR